jgi:hypothetical protein
MKILIERDDADGGNLDNLIYPALCVTAHLRKTHRRFRHAERDSRRLFTAAVVTARAAIESFTFVCFPCLGEDAFNLLIAYRIE